MGDRELEARCQWCTAGTTLVSIPFNIVINDLDDRPNPISSPISSDRTSHMDSGPSSSLALSGTVTSTQQCPVGSCVAKAAGWWPFLLRGCSVTIMCFLQADTTQWPLLVPSGSEGGFCQERLKKNLRNGHLSSPSAELMLPAALRAAQVTALSTRQSERAEPSKGPSHPNNLSPVHSVAGRTVLGATDGVSLSSGPQRQVGPRSSAEGATLTSPRSVATEVWHPKCARVVGIWLQNSILCPASGGCREDGTLSQLIQASKLGDGLPIPWASSESSVPRKDTMDLRRWVIWVFSSQHTLLTATARRVADKLPRPNLIIIKRLLSLLHQIR
ncbi:hypothetical protein QYF61_022285 [Mycteria americana]|uniref:Uncharacterized protein n=1 Tax=Mycteria americana TaxID=33587 RepID=A0AAN7MV76_MYCAM|nr:hypothetical protein QYF61_022285 [Mycteria americana]